MASSVHLDASFEERVRTFYPPPPPPALGHPTDGPAAGTTDTPTADTMDRPTTGLDGPASKVDGVASKVDRPASGGVVEWPLDDAARPQLSGARVALAGFSLHPDSEYSDRVGARVALAGFSFHPDAEYSDRVVCLACGLNVGAWEHDDEPMFSFHPDAECEDRVVCLACGLNVGAWEHADEPMEAHMAETPGECPFINDNLVAYEGPPEAC
ncbi:hypothetical protein T484DRAFT_1851772 [Baffinella frigidus]|nr:hypothetical protein T484DRAFT_1851772 [Cryptophyta sp. CCMP2293]